MPKLIEADLGDGCWNCKYLVMRDGMIIKCVRNKFDPDVMDKKCEEWDLDESVRMEVEG